MTGTADGGGVGSGATNGGATDPAVWLLSTRTIGAGLRTRPVRVMRDRGGDGLLVMTTPDAAKLAEVGGDPAVTLAAPTDDGWIAMEATAQVERDPETVAAALVAAGLDRSLPAALIRIRHHRIRRWTVHSAAMFDNDVAELSELSQLPPRLLA